ncbi:MAG: ABC transporter permease [Planctomycetota bacterium]
MSMSWWRLVRRGAAHYWRTNVGVVLGVAVAAAVLVGALAVGDSVRQSLRARALARIGAVDAALAGGDRFFRADLADRLARQVEQIGLAPVLQLPGVASVPGRDARAGIVEVLGVDDRFFALSPAGAAEGVAPAAPPRRGALLNARLAAQLEVTTGDTILVRVEQPSTLPRDTAMATVDDVSLALRVKVAGVLTDDALGGFALRAGQVPPFNLFVSLGWLQEQLFLDDRANLLLAGTRDHDDDLAPVLDTALRQSWTLADAELELLTPSPDAAIFELRSRRVFLDDAIATTVAEIEPTLTGVLTYFVNALRTDTVSTPYSMVTAIGPLSPSRAPGADATSPLLELVADADGATSVVLNDWTARDLGVDVGDTIEADYFALDASRRLAERTSSLTVRAIVPLRDAAADPTLMPAFPGLADADHCRDWDPGIPIQLDRLRPQDEKYWEDHRGTPKAFVTLATGRDLWANRFGNLTAIRGPAELADTLRARLPRELDPAGLGLFFRNVRGPALAAGNATTDFGGLFLGLSFFLITAALILTALLFAFGVEQRHREIGTLRAVGWRPSQVRRAFLTEALALAVLGSALGAGLGLLYTRAVLFGLATLWRDAVGATALAFHASTGSVVGGAIAAVVAALLAIAWGLRRSFSRAPVELLGSRAGVTPAPLAPPSRATVVGAVAAPVLAVSIMVMVGASTPGAAPAFFGAGFLLLIGMILGCRWLLHRLTHRSAATTLVGLGVRNAGRRPGRSLATIALLASGTFLVVSVQAHRLEPPQRATARASGTGGFTHFGRTTLPVVRDLTTAAGREAYGFDEDELAGVEIVPLRVRDGDDASCLNLSLPQQPRLLGVQPAALAARDSFTFAASAPPADAATANPWLLLDADYGPDVVPAIGDQASVAWAMHKAVGEGLTYRDDAGRAFEVRIVGTLANSILQGTLVVAERHLIARFPSAAGFAEFLIDAGDTDAAAVTASLTRSMEDLGLELTSTTARLRAFNAVQNTYLVIFQLLGGLGLLLGSAGLGMVVLRNTLERRGELALATAVGFAKPAVRRLLFSEHALLLGLGLGAGVLAATLALIPGTTQRADVAPWPVLLLVVGVAVSGALWVWLSSAVAVRGAVLEALRDGD